MFENLPFLTLLLIAALAWVAITPRDKAEQMSDSELTKQDSKLNRPRASYPAGIRGWLLFYTVVPTGLFGAVLPIWWVLSGTMQGFWGIVELEIARALINVLGMYLILFVRNPVTHYFHIALNAATGAELVLRGAVFDEILDVSAGLAVLVVWSGYWYTSMRVQETYCRKG